MILGNDDPGGRATPGASRSASRNCGVAIDAAIAGAPRPIRPEMGFKGLSICGDEDPVCVTVLISARETVARNRELAKFTQAYAEAIHYFLTNPEGTALVVAKYTKVVDREVVAYSIDSEAKAMQKTLQVDPKGVELILGFIGKTVPQAASAKPDYFYDPRFTNELHESGLLKRLWGDKL